MERRLLRAVAVQGVGAVFCAAVSFLLLMFLGRMLGADAFGAYVVVLNTAVLGLVVLEAGWPALIYRESARVHGGAVRGGLLMQGAVAHVLAAGALLALLAWGVGDGVDLPLALACMGLVALMNLVSARMRGGGAFGREALWQSAGRAASAALIVVVVMGFGMRSPGGIFFAWAAGLAVILALGGRRWLARPKWRGLSAGYRRVLPFVATAGLGVWLLKGDMVVLGGASGAAFLPADQLSFYAAGSRLTEAVLLLFAPVSNVLLRSLTLLAGSGTAFRSLLMKAISAAGGLGAVAVLMSAWLGDAAMPLLFGADFARAGPLLPWVVAMLPFALANMVLVQALIALRRERALALCMAAASVLMLGGLVWGTTLWGARGAAASVAGVHALLCLMCWRLVFRARGGWRFQAASRSAIPVPVGSPRCDAAQRPPR